MHSDYKELSEKLQSLGIVNIGMDAYEAGIDISGANYNVFESFNIKLPSGEIFSLIPEDGYERGEHCIRVVKAPMRKGNGENTQNF